MTVEKLKRMKGSERNKKLTKAYDKMHRLIEALNKKDIPSKSAITINTDIKTINSFSGTEKELTRVLRKTYSRTLAFLEKELKIVAKNHYLSLGMVFGMLAGTVFSSVSWGFGSMGMGSSTGMEISLGMILGMVVGIYLDKQAEKDGKQLALEAEESY